MSDKDVDFEIVRTKNPDVVRKILTIPALYEAITDDTSVPIDEYEPMMHDAVYYLLAIKDKQVLAMFVVHPLNNVVAIGHAHVLPKYWGQREQNKAIGKAMIQWVWDNTEFKKIVTTVPVTLKHVLAYTQRIGMKREGIMRKGYLKQGTLHDQYYMGVNKE